MESTTSGPAVSPRTRRYLSADTLFALLRQRFETVQDPRKQSHLTFTLPDVLASGLAMFSLKDPSLLAYGERQDDPSLKNVFGIKSIPSDTQFRDILDPIEVDALNEAFADVFAKLQRGGVLEQFRFIGDGYLVAIDGTDYFGSSNVRCENCLEKKSKDGTTRYAHQAVVAAMIHPKLSVVIPMAVEPIVKQDGEAKNDCERNATKCLLKRIKKQHPMLKLTITEDGLSSNTPHIADCKEHGYHFILDAKPGDHAHLFEQVVDAGDQSRLHVIRTAKVDKKGSRSETQLAKRVPLNKSNPDLLVNYVGRSDLTADGDIKSIFSWVADHRLTAETVLEIARDCRCRWRIENETFNTLKNQGYHFEHNCGHRKKSLSTVLLILMMFAFVVDQVQQGLLPSVSGRVGQTEELPQSLASTCSAIESFVFQSYQAILEAILTDRCRYRTLPP